MKTKLIGVCGRSGAGKTSVCSEFVKLGAAFIDTDDVYRQLTKPRCSKPSKLVRTIDAEFSGVILPDGNLDRKKLASIVFSDKEKLAKLNSLTHGAIMAETMKRAAKYSEKGVPAVLIDAPVLFEAGADKYCDGVLFISAPEDVLVSRICKRDGITEEEAEKRLASQKSDEEFRSLCDYVFENGRNCDIESQAEELLGRITGGDNNESEK